VLNTRGLQPWLESRVRHVFRRAGAALAEPGATDLQPGAWSGPMAREYLHDPARAISDWVDRRDFYHRAVLRWFTGDRRGALLVLNVTEDPSWQARLASFLGLPVGDGVAPIHANPASADEARYGLAERVAQVEDVLRRKGIEAAEWHTDTYVGAEG
jgi:hypothetical protein